MSSLFRINALALLALAALAGCDQGDEGQQWAPSGPGAPAQRASALIPGGGDLVTAPNPRAAPYYGSAAAVTEGMQLYNQMNCVGCHFNGGGGIGPPLMDDKWIYGGDIEQIYASIVQGRPNGMPAFKDKIPEQQVWQIAAYVKSLSGEADRLAAPSRADNRMRSTGPLNNQDPQGRSGDSRATTGGGG